MNTHLHAAYRNLSESFFIGVMHRMYADLIDVQEDEFLGFETSGAAMKTSRIYSKPEDPSPVVWSWFWPILTAGG